MMMTEIRCTRNPGSRQYVPWFLRVEPRGLFHICQKPSAAQVCEGIAYVHMKVASQKFGACCA
eukprot:8560240-Karenia_brevis.AAC.1